MRTTYSDKTEFHEQLMDAWDWVNREFPFDGYIPLARRSSYFEMPAAVLNWLSPPARILDFGAGPCDKTAMLSRVGYDVTACDDFGDDWYNLGNNRERILNYAAKAGIVYMLPDEAGNFAFKGNYYDAVILNNVIEHLHDSPRKLLNKLLNSVKSGGLLFVDVPNAANLRKRIDLARGRTNYPSFDSFYWSSPSWRGHVREFVKSDLVKLGRALALETVDISSHHYHLDAVSPLLGKLFVFICRFVPSLRESWLLIARKPAGWMARDTPTDAEAAAARSRQYFRWEKNTISGKDA